MNDSYNVESISSAVVLNDMKTNFWKNGFVIVRNLLSQLEMEKLRTSLEDPGSAIMRHSYNQDDGDGKNVKMVLWNHPGSDLTGMINRCEKVVQTCTYLMGGEVYHYHTKIVMKEAKKGGAFQWHQDYGYWYRNGVLFPDLISVQIAIDNMDLENGCLQILRSSHRLGRIDHVRIGEQVTADPQRIAEIKKVLTQMPVQLNSGDALFFHSNLLHRSDQNNSENRRWAMTSCYNLANNNPVKAHHHARYTPIEVVPDSAISECENLSNVEGKWFINPNQSHPEYLPPKDTPPHRE